MNSPVSSFTVPIKENAPLAGCSTFRVGGCADYLFEPLDEATLCQGFKEFHRAHLPITILGEGSNCLIHDEGVRGVVVRLRGSGFRGLKGEGDILQSGPAVRNHELAGYACQQGLSGFEFLAGFPGTVGGAIAGNAGSPEEFIGDRLTALSGITFTGASFSLNGEALKSGYRCGPILSERVVTQAVFKGVPDEISTIGERMEQVRKRRLKVDPKGFSCGSIFKNPPGIKAWEVIDSLGLRGHQIGGARVAEKHANWIVHEGKASASDIFALICAIQEQARTEQAIPLELELKLLGNFS